MRIALPTGSARSAIARTQVCIMALSIACAGACSKKRDQDSGDKSEQTPASAARAAPDPCAKAVPKHGQLWIEDDYPAALACARKLDKPLFLDLWAPWCHTCISMQEYIFPDAGLAAMKDRFVWAALDTDKEVNAALQEKFPPEVWPTFYVVDPRDEAVHGRYLGAAPVTQLRDFLVQSESSYAAARAGSLPADSPVRLLVEADRANVRDDLDKATEGYRAALARAPADWPLRAATLVSLAAVMGRNQDWEGCAELAESAMDQTGKGANATDFVYRVNQCADFLEPERARSVRERAATRLAALIDDPTAQLSIDDLSDAMANLRTVYLALDRKPEADALAERQRALLDKAAADAPNPWVAMTYNWPRCEVYVYLGRGLELVPVLEKSIADLPNEYDPPYRLAWIYLQSGQPEKAIEPAQRALSLIYGPRKARALTMLADIYKALDDRDNERKTRAQVVELFASLPPGQFDEAKLQAAKDALAAMDQPPDSAEPAPEH